MLHTCADCQSQCWLGGGLWKGPASEVQDPHPFLAARHPHQKCLLQLPELVWVHWSEPAVICWAVLVPADIQGLLNLVQRTATALAVHLGSVLTGHLGLCDHTVSFAGNVEAGCTGLAGHTVLHGHSRVAHLAELDLAHTFAVKSLQVHYLHSQLNMCHSCM